MSAALAAILASLGREICGPLATLREHLNHVTEEGKNSRPEKQRDHAQIMVSLCDELTRLTHETLGCA